MSDLPSAAAVAARGNNVVFAAPPSPAFAVPVLAAVIARVDEGRARPVLMVAPEAALGAWISAAAAAARAQGRRSAGGPTPARATHHLVANRIDLLVTTLSVATELLRRSALRLDQLTALILVWPELELSDESFVPLFADLPKDTQRIIVTADPAGTAVVAERHAWRAPVLGPLGNGSADQPVPRFRTVSVAWEGRAAALGALADLGDLDEITVWTADDTGGDALATRLAAHGAVAHLVGGDAVGKAPVIFYDPPTPALLAQADPTSSFLLVAPGAEPYAARAIGRQDPVELPNASEQAGQAMTVDRQAIRARIEAGPDRGAFATLAPLFERWSAPEIAVALQSLWLDARTRPRPTPAGPTTERRPKGAKVWTNIGRKEGLAIGEWMGLLNLDLGIRRESFGKVEIKETFTLTEFHSEDAARDAVEKLAGRTFKNRRLTARIDRGPTPKRPA